MDATEPYNDLAEKMKEELPLRTFPIRELVQVFRGKGYPITLKTELTIKDVHNSGDVSGIMCVVQNDNKNVIACALTHLIFSQKSLLFREISDYQRKRERRIKKLNKLGSN
ncbi:MAG: hypothetical protein WD426_13665 [Anditalea sp.]